MSMNLLIKVDGNLNPENNNIIIYNSIKKCWETQSKDKFLIDLKNEIKSKNKEIEELNKKISKLNEKISKLAKIVKGELI